MSGYLRYFFESQLPFISAFIHKYPQIWRKATDSPLSLCLPWVRLACIISSLNWKYVQKQIMYIAQGAIIRVLTSRRCANREFKLRVIRQTANRRQRTISRYQAIKSKWTCCFKTEIHHYSFDARKKIRNENIQRKFCQENLYMSFAVHGNVKLKLPNSEV
jgi:hypothetical protein